MFVTDQIDQSAWPSSLNTARFATVLGSNRNPRGHWQEAKLVGVLDLIGRQIIKDKNYMRAPSQNHMGARATVSANIRLVILIFYSFCATEEDGGFVESSSDNT